MEIVAGCQARVGKSKQANFWKVIGVCPPLPETFGITVYILARKKRKLVVDITKIKEVKKEDE